MSLLETILQANRRRLAERKAQVPLAHLERAAADAPPVRSLVEALAARDFSVIAEHKKRSPSAGAMRADSCGRAFEVYARLPWVSAVSVLTDVDHFDGSLGDVLRGREVTAKPILRKDFIYDEYQVWEARAAGADAILLMTSVHLDTPERLVELYRLAGELGMDVLFEIGMGHGDPRGLAAIVPEGARLWGVNARRFKAHGRVGMQRDGDLSRDITTSLDSHDELLALVPDGAIAVAESGLQTARDLRRTRDLGYRAALIGTAFVAGPRSIDEVADDLGALFADELA